MKRTLQVVGGLGLAAAVTLGAPAAAQAGTHHKDSRSAAKSGHAAAERVTHHCATAKRCRPKPLPRPVNGWPCAKTHSCKTRHHWPVCPPVVKPPAHKPPVHHAPRPKPPVPQRIPVASSVPELPRTGSDVTPLLLSGFGLIGGGTFLLRKARVR